MFWGKKQTEASDTNLKNEDISRYRVRTSYTYSDESGEIVSTKYTYCAEFDVGDGVVMVFTYEYATPKMQYCLKRLVELWKEDQERRDKK